MPTRMRDLPRGTEFRLAPDYRVPHRYRVTVAAGEHTDGWVEVRNVSMTDAQAQELLGTPGTVEPGCDPRDGVFMTGQTDMEVEVLS
jgi:hypothetical protein